MMFTFRSQVLPTLGALVLMAPLVAHSNAAAPEPPRILVDTTYVPRPGQTISVSAGGDLQRALDAAQPGDRVLLAPGAVFTGNFELRPKTGSDWIYIETDATPLLTPSGVRISPQTGLPKIVSPNSAPALYAGPGAANYRIAGIEVTTSASYSYQLIALEKASRITIDRCYIHGTPSGTLRRGILGNASHLAVIDSYIADAHEAGMDSQAILVYDSPGPGRLLDGGRVVVADLFEVRRSP